MLTTKTFTFGRDGIIVLLCRVTTAQLCKILRMCIDHARIKHVKKPFDWDASSFLIPTLVDVVA